MSQRKKSHYRTQPPSTDPITNAKALHKEAVGNVRLARSKRVQAIQRYFGIGPYKGIAPTKRAS